MNSVKLGDLATYINGYAFKPEDRGEEGLPIIRIQDLTGNAYDLGFYDGEYPKKIEINDGDVLISWSASLGVYVWNRGKALLNQHIFKVVFDKKEIDKDYFVFAVKHNLDKMSSLTHGATMKHIVKKDFDNILVPYPSKNEQEEVARILTKIQNIIDIDKQQLLFLDELIKARFVELFDGCEKKRLGDYCSTHARIGWQKLTRAEFLEKGDYYLVTGWDFDTNNHKVDFSKCYYVTKERYGQDKKLMLKEGDVLLTKDGTLGKVALIEHMDKPATLNGHIFVIRSLHGDLLPEFLVGAFTSEDFKYQMESNKTGSTIVGITQKTLLEFELPIPSIDKQKEYVEFSKQIDKSKFVCQKKIELYQELLNKKMDEYFNPKENEA